MIQYKELEREVLELINQYSIAGESVSPAYNNQADYLARIPNLLNSALMDIRTGPIPARASATLRDGADVGGGWVRYPFPDDCWRILSGGVFRLSSDRPPEPAAQFRFIGNAVILPQGEFAVEYFRYPPHIPSPPISNYMVQEDDDILHAAALYAAAQLVMMEDEFTYAALSNEYETRIVRMRPPVTAEISSVTDRYHDGYGNFY